MSDESWMALANCKGMDLNKFFDDYENYMEVQLEVDSICANCTVSSQCLEWAIREKLEGGVFGRKYFSQAPKKKSKRRQKIEVLH